MKVGLFGSSLPARFAIFHRNVGTVLVLWHSSVAAPVYDGGMGLARENASLIVGSMYLAAPSVPNVLSHNGAGVSPMWLVSRILLLICAGFNP